MEALVAVGLAGNIVQFVQLAGKLISEASEIRKKGGPKSAQELKTIAEDLTTQAESIHKCLTFSTATAGTSQEDQNLITTAENCRKAGAEFIAYVDDLTKNSASSSRVGSLGASIKFQFQYHKIQAFASTLETLRGALTLAALLAFKTAARTSNIELLDRLENLEQHSSTENDALYDITQLVLAHLQARTAPKLELISSDIQNIVKDLQILRGRLPLDREQAILSWLNFRQMAWRYEEVAPAHRETYAWIFSQPSASAGWSDYRAHLVHNVSTPYFINGKAGSGKSTLMKYIVGHETTKKCLAQWALSDNKELIVVKFFFWNLGTPLQKSASGLLRALLYSVLKEREELVPAVFPSIYQDWNSGFAEPHDTEVRAAWRCLLERSKSFLKIAIFIDGIDEFEGDDSDLINFIHSLASLNVKVVVSSRPINTALEGFRNCPQLRLQDLTKRDMEIYIRETLTKNARMVQFSKFYPHEATKLVQEIREKADGVFLWVRLVVRLLIDGLEAGDNAEDLQEKLRLLPGDLRKLYRQMLGKMSDQYQAQAASIFQLLQAWKLIDCNPLGVLTLHFALQKPSHDLQMPAYPLDLDLLNFHYAQMSAQIRSRCCGLLEERLGNDHTFEVGSISSNAGCFDLDTLLSFSVDYLHRTVAEFLTSDDVILEMQQTRIADFDPIEHLISACLSTIKICGSLEMADQIHEIIHDTFRCYNLALPDNRKKLNPYITALDKIMTKFQKEPFPQQTLCFSEDTHWSMPTDTKAAILLYLEKGASVYYPNRDAKWFQRTANIFTVTARWGLTEYLEELQQDKLANPGEVHTLILHALEPWLQVSLKVDKGPLRDRIATLLFLLSQDVIASVLSLRQSFSDILVEAWVKVSLRPEAQALKKRGYSEKYSDISDDLTEKSILTASFIATSRSPEPLLLRFAPTQLQDMVTLLNKASDSQAQWLGEQLSRILIKHGMTNVYCHSRKSLDHTSNQCMVKRKERKGRHNQASPPSDNSFSPKRMPIRYHPPQEKPRRGAARNESDLWQNIEREIPQIREELDKTKVIAMQNKNSVLRPPSIPTDTLKDTAKETSVDLQI